MEGTSFPTKRDVKRHWNAQEPSIFRPPYARDKGLSIVANRAEVREVLQMEFEGQEVELYKERTPAVDITDAVAKAQHLLQWHHKNPTDEAAFKAQVKTLADQQLYLILYGKMSDYQRTVAMDRLAKLIFEEQKRSQDLAHRERMIEEKRAENLLKGKARLQELLEKRLAQNALKGEVDSEQ